MTKAKILFPGWRYGPDGELQLFQREGDVPQGWSRIPPDRRQEPDDLGELKRGELEELAADLGIEDIAGSGKNGSVLISDLREAIAAKRAE